VRGTRGISHDGRDVTEETEEQQEPTQDEEQDQGQEQEQGSSSGDGEESSSSIEEEKEEARKELEELEGDPPQNLEDWPSGDAKYETFGGSEHETSYDEAATSELGPSDVRHHPDGSVTVHGEEVDDPKEYKGEPIPGGPTDPDAAKASGERDLSEESSVSKSDSDDDEDDSSDEDSSSEESSSDGDDDGED
jgi:hypothetical protein